MEKVVQMINRISTSFAVLVGIMMGLGMVLVLIEIVARSVFDSTIYISDEYTGYFMVAITFLGMAYTLKERGHIRMTFLNNLKIFKDGKGRHLLEIYTNVVGLTLFVVITVVSTGYVWNSFVTGTQSMQVSQTYLAIPQFAIPLGSLLITLQFLAELLQTIIRLRKGDVTIYVEDKTLGR